MGVYVHYVITFYHDISKATLLKNSFNYRLISDVAHTISKLRCCRVRFVERQVYFLRLLANILVICTYIHTHTPYLYIHTQ